MKLDLFSKKEEAMLSLLAIEENWQNLPVMSLKELDPERTAIVFVDVIEGFVNQGALATERALGILEAVKRLNEATLGFHKIYFVDCHTEESPEFSAYPPHCLSGGPEVELVKELEPENSVKSKVIYKNSTNGFMAKDFQAWLAANQEVDHFVITGLVTDICVMTFALSLKTYFNEADRFSRLMLPLTVAETFDLPATNHQAEVMNVFAVYNMQMNGIEIYRDFC